ncbi:MAG: hypothetical protein F6K14_14145 [Symploca sp. SIO2C1]|nr:hypothetical protein [Symploca sp. SIO2C1]
MPPNKQIEKPSLPKNKPSQPSEQPSLPSGELSLPNQEALLDAAANLVIEKFQNSSCEEGGRREKNESLFFIFFLGHCPSNVHYSLLFI